jgi:chromosome partitioning protein
VIVLGNEKGGSGKSTVASHVAVGLLKARQRVATIDLDARHQSFTRYINNLRAWAAHAGLGLEMLAHFRVGQMIRLVAWQRLSDLASVLSEQQRH